MAASITVTSNADVVAADGRCTLREAITAANSNAPSAGGTGECEAGSAGGQDAIGFAIANSGPHTIQLSNQLPAIGSSLLIDGYTQPGAVANSISALSGFNADLRIIIDGSQSGPLSKPALRINGGVNGVTIRGLEIAGVVSTACCADSAIDLAAGSNNVIITGNILRNNNARGVAVVNGAIGLRIGGPLPAERNLIYGNGFGGIDLSDCLQCVIQNNWIGIRPTANGLVAGSNSNGIGGGSGSPGLQISDNWIAGNANAGVSLTSAATGVIVSNNLIGGSIANGVGIRLSPNGTVVPSGNQISNNVITGNTGVGIGLSSNQAVNGFVGNVFAGNRTYANGGVEIDLGPNGGSLDGVTANDVGDADTGPNGLQNYPVLASALTQGTLIQIPYQVSSPEGQYTLEFSFSTLCDASGNGLAGVMSSDPVRLLNQPPATTASFTLPPGVSSNGFVSATATSADGTSEYSSCVAYSFVDALLKNGFE